MYNDHARTCPLTQIRYPYSKLKAPNVQGTIDAIELCAVGRPKNFVFVSSTAVLDNDHYVRLSDRLCNEGKAGVPEDDDLSGGSRGLGKSSPGAADGLPKNHRYWLWAGQMGQRIPHQGSRA